MLIDWLLQHHSAPLVLAWGAGVVWAWLRLRRGRLSGAAIDLRGSAILLCLALMLGAGLLHILPIPTPPGAGLLLELDSVRLEAQWAVLAALVLFTVPPRRGPLGVASLAPLLLNGWQGGGALFAATIIAATGALERGQPGRKALLAAMLLFPAAALVDDQSLALWARIRNLGLGMDASSLVVDMAEQLLRLAGWAAALVAVFVRQGALAGKRSGSA